MNNHQLKHFIQIYKQNFAKVHDQEIYKWKAVKCFQDNWNFNASNFPVMLENSLSETENLLESVQYFPRKMLLGNSKKSPGKTRMLFLNLFDETQDLLDRIKTFHSNFGVINKMNFPGKNGYQDPRAILVYLSLNYPDKYFLYKYNIFKTFTQLIDFNYKPIKGRIENIGQFQSMCDLIRHELIQDQELLKLHKDRITNDCYFDDSYNILTQDFIYAVATHLNKKSKSIPKKPSSRGKVDYLTTDSFNNSKVTIDFNTSMTNHIQREIENKRIGDLGELWVKNFEIQKLLRIGKKRHAARIEHISKERGDGSGFDIKSFDLKGKEIFIEVKTTIGDLSTPFFITRQELERSLKEKKKYFLYRLYNYDDNEDDGDLAIINGELTKFCNNPWTYKVKIKVRN